MVFSQWSLGSEGTGGLQLNTIQLLLYFEVFIMQNDANLCSILGK